MRGRPAFGPISHYPTVLLRANRGTGNRSQRSETYQLDRIMPTLSRQLPPRKLVPKLVSIILEVGIIQVTHMPYLLGLL